MMIDQPAGTSYVRARHDGAAAAAAVDSDSALESRLVTQRIWDLLETPQTVDSLCRALSTDDGDPQRYRHGVLAVMESLYDRNLIEITPDS
jgi:hypothetical protein